MRWLAVERVLVGAHDSVKRAYDLWRSTRVTDLRGRRCHCPPLPVHYLHSEGLREGCDFVVDEGSNVECRERGSMPVERIGRLAAGIEPGSVVYVKADRLPFFLPHLRAPVVLVTGDSDYAPVREHASLLEDPRLVHWFAQNCDLDHPRVTPLPIGLDNPRYTRLDKRLGFLLAMLLGRMPLDLSFSRNDIGDQEVLQSVPVRPFADKPPRAMATFHCNQKLIRPDFERLPDRREAYRALSGKPGCHFFPRRLPQRACWEAHQHFAFELSPQGNGLDCFRTWEALVLETVPIVRSSPLNRLYAEFPIVVVDSWEEVTPANLERWHERHAGAFTPDLRRRLTCEHWLERIRAR